MVLPKTIVASKALVLFFDVASVTALLLAAGLHLPYLIGGAAGGIVNVLFLAKSGPREILGTIAVGALVANYAADSATIYVAGALSWHIDTIFASFVIGFAGMLICKFTSGFIQSKLSSATTEGKKP